MSVNHGWRLGNDVVDLTSPRCLGKASHTRFLERVFSPGEREILGSLPSADQNPALWLFWAGKEAIFKSATKALGAPPVFRHPRFQVRFDSYEIRRLAPAPPKSAPASTISGWGRYEDLAFTIRGRIEAGHLHALAWIQKPQGRSPEVVWEAVRREGAPREGRVDAPEKLRRRFTPQEWACISHEASARTRLAARKALADALGVEEGRLEIRCASGKAGRRIPQAYLDGAPIPVDLTLSHDGPAMAWAFQPYRPQGR